MQRMVGRKKSSFGKELEAVGAVALSKLTSETSPLDFKAWFEFGLRRTQDGIKAFAAR
jgi:hypothetical protein